MLNLPPINDSLTLFLLAWASPAMVTLLVIMGSYRRKYGVLFESKVILFAMVVISILYPLAWLAILGMIVSKDSDTGADLIRQERIRQTTKEGWSKKHDSNYHCYELACAAMSYIHHAMLIPSIKGSDEQSTKAEALAKVSKWEDNRFWKDSWPWSDTWWKPAPKTFDGKVRDLTKAGALIAAQIDLLIERKHETEELLTHLQRDYSDKKLEDILASDLDPLVRFHIEKWAKQNYSDLMSYAESNNA